MKIGYMGMSHLGLVSSICSASFCKKVICFDLSLKKINELKKGLINIKEKKLNEKLKKNNKKIFFTDNIKKLKKCDFIYLSVDTKTIYNIIYLKEVKKYINIFKANFSQNKNLVILSQLPFDFIKKSNLEKNKNINIQVETLIFGNAVERFSKPERIIFGTENEEIPEKIYSFLKKFKCPIIKMNRQSALLTKMSINLYLASQVTVTNFLSAICEKSNAKWEPIKLALSLDKRIGEFSYLSPGLGLSGGNIERDLFNLNKLCKEKKLKNKIVESIIHDSNNRKRWIDKIFNKFHKNKYFKFSILGISYKSGTDSVKNSPAIELIKKFKKTLFYIYDPLVKNTQIKLSNAKFENKIQKILLDSNVVILMNNDNIYLNFVRFFKKDHIVIDPFGVLKNYKKKFKNYYFMGGILDDL